ncbi:MAG: hypothetical protein ACQEP1_05880 [Nanobdellota archaeon]
MTRFWEHLDLKVFQAPLMPWGLIRCIYRRIPPHHIVKANWGLSLGGEFCSKYDNSIKFNQKRFLSYSFIPHDSDKEKRVKDFMRRNKLDFPIFLKPDKGRGGKGVAKIKNSADLKAKLRKTNADMIVQEYDPGKEFGVFYYSLNGKPGILSINSKEMPYVIGDGKSSVEELLRKDNHLKRYIKELYGTDMEKIVPDGEKYIVSEIGNHARGCTFKEKSHLATDELLKTLYDTVKGAGYNYGRFDVKADSEEELMKGNIRIVEVNGVFSLSTNYFDPGYDIFTAYSILMEQYNLLIEVAKENQQKKAKVPGFKDFVKKGLYAEKILKTYERSIKALKT